MRRSRAAFFASSILVVLAACSSGEDDSGGGGAAPNNPSAADPTSPSGEKPEAPLTARAVCPTVETGPSFAQGCSGTGSGDVVCTLNDSRCGSDSCVYDSRNGKTFSFYCSPKCTVGDATRCPLGYECVAESASCAGGGGEGVCALRSGSGCDPSVKIKSGRFFEGPGGELYNLAGQYSPERATLSVRSGNTFKTVTTWDGDATIRALVRNGDTLLVVTASTEVVVSGGKATAQKRAASNSYATAYGVAKDGSFVLLDGGSGAESFAALMRRGDDGTWTELGPTRQRVAKIVGLGKGFLAVCQKSLCSSADGETFTPVSLPNGVTFDEKTTFAVTGLSTDDFHLAVGGGLYHHRKGAWVEEGPRGKKPGADAGSGSDRPDLLRSFADGTVVFHTWTGERYATYVYGDECWTFSSGRNLDGADLVKGENGNAFVWSDSYDGELCSTPTR